MVYCGRLVSFRSPGWFADPRQTPGGAFIDEGIYWLDQLRWLAGSEVIQVEAKMANLVHRDIEVEDWGMATLTFANGLHIGSRMDDQCAASDRPIAQAKLRPPFRGDRRAGEIIDEGLRVPGRAVLAAGPPAGSLSERPGSLSGRLPHSLGSFD